eukprot:2333944-Amphidinium_carterae.2
MRGWLVAHLSIVVFTDILGEMGAELDLMSASKDDCRPCSFFCYSLVGCNRGKVRRLSAFHSKTWDLRYTQHLAP